MNYMQQSRYYEIEFISKDVSSIAIQLKAFTVLPKKSPFNSPLVHKIVNGVQLLGTLGWPQSRWEPRITRHYHLIIQMLHSLWKSPVDSAFIQTLSAAWYWQGSNHPTASTPVDCDVIAGSRVHATRFLKSVLTRNNMFLSRNNALLYRWCALFRKRYQRHWLGEQCSLLQGWF